ncbi:hypothetical protein [Fischerella thermalis]|uniref:hypothetical protein n=1 Tax=Fischerella thermalis TaxID=372787 RepID=UPI00307ECE65
MRGGNWALEITNHQPPTTNQQLLTTNHQPPTNNHQLPTTNHQPTNNKWLFSGIIPLECGD